MMKRRTSGHALPALAAVLLAILAAGCGGEEEPRLLTEGRSESLLDLLDDAEKQFEDDECDELANTLEEFADQVKAIQGEVDQNVRTVLREESADLVSLQDDCEEPVEEPPPVEPTVPPPTVEPTVPPPTEEETTEEETTEEQTTEEETTEEEKVPPEEPPGNSGGGGGGQVPPEAESGGSSGKDKGSKK